MVVDRLKTTKLEIGSNDTVTLTVYLQGVAPVGGIKLLVDTDDIEILVPNSVTVASGSDKVDVTVTSNTITPDTTARVNVRYKHQVYSVKLSKIGASIGSLSLNRNSVRGGDTVTITLALSAPAGIGGYTVNLSQTGLPPYLIVNLPKTLTVASGSTSSSITVTTRKVSRDISTVISANDHDMTASCLLKVTRS